MQAEARKKWLALVEWEGKKGGELIRTDSNQQTPSTLATITAFSYLLRYNWSTIAGGLCM